MGINLWTATAIAYRVKSAHTDVDVQVAERHVVCRLPGIDGHLLIHGEAAYGPGLAWSVARMGPDEYVSFLRTQGQ